MSMNFEQALDLMEQGKTMLSEVSETVYSMDMTGKGKLFAEGLEVKADYITEKEMLGDWIEVNVIETLEEANKLSDSDIKNIMDKAWVKIKFDIKAGRSKLL